VSGQANRKNNELDLLAGLKFTCHFSILKMADEIKIDRKLLPAALAKLRFATKSNGKPDTKRARMSIDNIAALTGLSRSVVLYNLDIFLGKRKRQRTIDDPVITLSPMTIKFLTSPTQLDRTAHMSIKARVIDFIARYPGKRLTVNGIRKTYKEAGIKYKQVVTKVVVRRNATDKTKMEDEVKYKNMVSIVTEAISKHTEVIFVDECVFSTRTVKKMAWANKRCNIEAKLYFRQQVL
jgi:hypothetical protein